MPRSDSSWETLLTRAQAAWSDERPHDALQLCDRAALLGDVARHKAAMLRGDILLQLGDAAGALSSFDSVADPSVPDPLLDCARGLALFELARFAEADSALQSALRGNATLADAHYALGVMAEISGSGNETEHFRRARKYAPERYDLAPKLSTDEFKAVVAQGLERVPERVRTAMQATPVLVTEMPRLDDLRQSDPPMSPQSFGMYVALAIAPNQLADDVPTEPAILLFKRNLERACPHRIALIQAIRDTVLEEAVAAFNLPHGDDLEEWPGMH